MVSSFTTNKDIEKPGNGDYVDTWNIPLNGDMTVLDYALGTAISFNATSGSQTLGSYDHDTKELVTYSYIPLIITVINTLAADITYTIPTGVGGQWIVRNTTTDGTGGPFTVTFASGGGGTSTVIPRGSNVVIFCDGTNVRSIGSLVPGADTEIIFNNNGTLGASADLTWDGVTLTANAIASITSVQATTSVTAGTTSSDGIGNLREVPPNAKTGAYVLALTDSGKYISITTGGVTVPPSSTAAFTAGQTISVYNNSSSNQTITQGAGVTMTQAGTNSTGNRTLAQYGLCTILCTATNAFVITGAGIS